MSVVAGDLSACSLAEALSARATRSEESKIHGPPRVLYATYSTSEGGSE